MYFPTSETLSLCFTPLPSKFGAAITFLRCAHDSVPQPASFVRGDNKHVVDLFYPLTPPPPSTSSTTNGTWSCALKSTLRGFPNHICLNAAWIKGDAGFPGIECSDSYSKWISYATEWNEGLPAPVGTTPQRRLQIFQNVTAPYYAHCTNATVTVA